MMQSITPNSLTISSGSCTPSSNRPALSRLQLQAEMARRSLCEFVRQAWPVLEPHTPFIDGMHMRTVCEHLQAVSEDASGI